jgi:hypothetical protein
MPLLERVYELERARQVSIIPFFYTAQFLTGIAPATSVTVNTGVQSDSDFICRYISLTVYNSPNVIVLAGLAALTMSLFDNASGRTLMDNATAIQNVTGGAMGTLAGSGGSAPFIFPEPWLVRAGGTIQTTLTNLSAVTPSPVGFPRVDIAFSGMKVFKFGSSSPAGSLL